MSGASLLSSPDVANKAYGQARPQDHNDLQGISEIRNIITSSPNRAVDNLLLNLSATQPQARTAIVYGPLIYGMGRGPANKRSIQLPDVAKATLQYGHGVQVGKGLSCWNNIHISDLTRLIVRLVQEATSTRKNASLWNENGVYFAENGKLVRLAPFSLNIWIFTNVQCSRLVRFQDEWLRSPTKRASLGALLCRI